MNWTKHALTVSIAAALMSQGGFAHNLKINLVPQRVELGGAQRERIALIFARESEPGDDRGGRGEKQPGDDRGRNKGKPGVIARETEPGDVRGEKQPADDRGRNKGKPGVIARETEPGDIRGEKQPGDDRGRNKGKPKAV